MKALKAIVLASLMFGSVSVYSADCKNNPIYCRILKLNPHIDKSRAFWLSNEIHREAKAVGIDPMISVAILMQENAFKSENTFHVEIKTEKFCDEKGCYERTIENKKVADMGIAQINIGTAMAYKLDYERLFNLDTEYAIKCHFIILSDKMKMCAHLGKDAWTCYHSTTEHHRQRYKELVSRYL